MDRELVFLDTILLQQDMRVRLPKAIVVNIDGKPGHTHLDVYFDAITKNIVLKNREMQGNDKGEKPNG